AIGLSGCGDAHLGDYYGRRTHTAFDAQAQAKGGDSAGTLDADDAKITLARQRGRALPGTPGAAYGAAGAPYGGTSYRRSALPGRVVDGHDVGRRPRLVSDGADPAGRREMKRRARERGAMMVIMAGVLLLFAVLALGALTVLRIIVARQEVQRVADSACLAATTIVKHDGLPFD